MDVMLGKDLYESFTRYQGRVIRSLDSMAQRYGFEIIDASRSPEQVFQNLKRRIAKLLRVKKKAGPPAARRRPATKEARSQKVARLAAHG